MYRTKTSYKTIIITLCLCIIFAIGCKKKDAPTPTDKMADSTIVTQIADTTKVISNPNNVSVFNMSYDNIVGDKINEFQKPRYSKLNSGESRYLVDSEDGLVSLEIYGELTKVNKVTIRFSISTSEIEQYAILLTVNPILENILARNSQFINKWHEDTMTRAATEIANREIVTLYDDVNGRSIEYKVWKTIGMVLITIQL
jgi:hypothetical protein